MIALRCIKYDHVYYSLRPKLQASLKKEKKSKDKLFYNTNKKLNVIFILYNLDMQHGWPEK